MRAELADLKVEHASRVEQIGQLQTQVAQLQAQLAEQAEKQKQEIDRVLQQQLGSEQAA